MPFIDQSLGGKPVRLDEPANNQVIAYRASGQSYGPVNTAIIRVGGQLTEATTTSTTAVDLLSVSALTIAALEPFFFIYAARQSAGSTLDSAMGLKINATVVSAPSITDSATWRSSGNNAAEGGGGWVFISPRLASYLRGASGGHSNGAGGGGFLNGTTVTADMPDAQVTDVVIRAISVAGRTLGADELHVYRLVTS